MRPEAKHAIELSRETILAKLSRGAERRLGMTAESMLQAYRDGDLEDPGYVWDLIVLASLLPQSDPLFVEA